ncbi:hypothetical protein CCM_09353 [Cordyceps militaris CM01]|uniref:Uncharacterized protein n=1 Tax=Cordyceps militaris (strain CM01) TaxID=983644 RepID=G3JUJ5_CORMM|nr:uncharacterized protein CCM_09353 [Cordyceps militaris CM01]EGX87731.1 hypothetical protein CCM_09353 [Cordyceps militaris CM01]
MKTAVILISLFAATISAEVEPSYGYGGVKFCKHWNQGQPCITLDCCSSCDNMPSDWNDQVSSYQVTRGCGPCTFYEHNDCGGASFTSHDNEPQNVPEGWWNDRISSYRCS